MSILTSWTFWLIFGAIVLIMALIGYLAEGTDFAKKALSGQPKKSKNKENPKETVVSEITNDLTSNINDELKEVAVVSADRPIEVLNVGGQNADNWNDVIPKIDTRLETAYTVSNIDDWSAIPETNNELPEVKLDNLETREENIETENQIDNNFFPDITPKDLEKTEKPFEQESVVEIPEVNEALETPVSNEVIVEKETEDIWK